jgi:hypothetical protein
VVYLDVSSERKILAKWMSLKTVVSENPSKIGVVGKIHSKHVPYFAFVPIGSGKYAPKK